MKKSIHLWSMPSRHPEHGTPANRWTSWSAVLFVWNSFTVRPWLVLSIHLFDLHSSAHSFKWMVWLLFKWAVAVPAHFLSGLFAALRPAKETECYHHLSNLSPSGERSGRRRPSLADQYSSSSFPWVYQTGAEQTFCQYPRDSFPNGLKSDTLLPLFQLRWQSTLVWPLLWGEIEIEMIEFDARFKLYSVYHSKCDWLTLIVLILFVNWTRINDMAWIAVLQGLPPSAHNRNEREMVGPHRRPLCRKSAAYHVQRNTQGAVGVYLLSIHWFLSYLYTSIYILLISWIFADNFPEPL